MKKTSYNTLCNQAQLVISNKMVELKNEIAKLADEMATLANPKNMAKEFFASGMSFAMYEDHPWVDARAVIRDASGDSLLGYLDDKNTIKPSAEKDKLWQHSAVTQPSLIHAL